MVALITKPSAVRFEGRLPKLHDSLGRMAYGGTDLLEMDRNSRQLFITFMAKTTEFEELGKRGGELLVGFHQELDNFRRPALNETSQVLADIIERNQTERLRTYVDAGCRHFHVDAQVTIKLNEFLRGLLEHMERAQELLKDLESNFNEATKMMEEATRLMVENLKISGEEDSIRCSSGSESDEDSIPDHQQFEISDYVAMMSVIYGMLRQDYAMQEKVVSDLQLDTPSEILQSYYFMWTLHPFVDERIINEALGWI